MSLKTVRLGNLVSIKTGKLDANASSKDGKYPFFTCAKEPLKISSFSYDCECVLVAGNGDLNVKYYNGKFDAYQRTYIVECLDIETINTRYLFHFLDTYLVKLREQSIGGVIKYIKLENLTDALIPLPPLDTQKRISEILDAADALRRKDQDLLKKYDELAQAIFIEMFGDPVKNVKGWDMRKLQDVVHPDRIVTYGIVQAGEHIHNGVPYIKTGDMKDGEILIDQLQRTSNEIAHSYRRSQLYKGDIVMSIRATVGTVALLPDSLIGANLTQGTARISPSENINRLFLYYYLKNEFAQNWISSYAKGATFREITLTKLRELPILNPPLNMQIDFNNRIDTIHKSKLNSKSLTIKSRLLFESLIQKAFKGELES